MEDIRAGDCGMRIADCGMERGAKRDQILAWAARPREWYPNGGQRCKRVEEELRNEASLSSFLFISSFKRFAPTA